jgi:hypothetical protein
MSRLNVVPSPAALFPSAPAGFPVPGFASSAPAGFLNVNDDFGESSGRADAPTEKDDFISSPAAGFPNANPGFTASSVTFPNGNNCFGESSGRADTPDEIYDFVSLPAAGFPNANPGFTASSATFPNGNDCFGASSGSADTPTEEDDLRAASAGFASLAAFPNERRCRWVSAVFAASPVRYPNSFVGVAPAGFWNDNGGFGWSSGFGAKSAGFVSSVVGGFLDVNADFAGSSP